MIRLNPSLFDWSRWRAGCLAEFGVQTRYEFLIAAGSVLRQHAIGWCFGENLACRPKPGTMAVMFWSEERHFWTHLTVREFREVFGVQTNEFD